MGTRGRKAIEVTAAELQTALADLEKAQPDGKFPNRSALWASLEKTAWAQSRNPRPLTGQVAMMLAKKFNSTLQTPVGQKGRVKGQGPVNTGPRTKKKMNADVLASLIKGVPEKSDDKEIRSKLMGTINKAANGSLKAVIKLKCLDCCNWEKKEVSLCTIMDCPNWNFRPYKHKESLTAGGRERISLGLIGEKEDDTEGTD